MEIQLLEKIKEELLQGNKVAYAVIVKIGGSSPRKEGTAMVVLENGDTLGTVGGGTVEYQVITKALHCMKKEESKLFTFGIKLNSKSDEECAGNVSIFVQTFILKNKLIIFGGGHVAYNLYKFAVELGFSVVIFEDREEFCNKERFPRASEIIYGNIVENMSNYSFDKNCYVVLSSSSHKSDENILKEIVDKEVAYIGMLGSKKKVSFIMKSLLDKGVGREKLQRVYAPIGIKIGGETPQEVAFSMMAEILLIKNNGSLVHMKKDIDEILA